MSTKTKPTKHEEIEKVFQIIDSFILSTPFKANLTMGSYFIELNLFA